MTIAPERIAAWIEANFDFRTRKDGSEYQICNPFDGDTGYNFNINVHKASCHDWRSDNWAGFSRATGKPNKKHFIQFVRLYRGCSWAEAVREVAGEKSSAFLSLRMLREANLPAEPVDEQPMIVLPRGAIRLLDSKEVKMAGILLRWLESRGVPRTEVERYDIHHVGPDVVWPYYEYDEIVYWQTRSRVNKIFRFPPKECGVGKEEFLFGFDQVDYASHLVITEAIFGVHALRLQAIATGGAVLQKRQLLKIDAIGPRDGIVLAPDNDRAGRMSVLENGRLLLERLRWKVYYSLPPALPYTVDGEQRHTKDWGELGEHVVGWQEVHGLMEKGIKRLDEAELLRLRLQWL